MAISWSEDIGSGDPVEAVDFQEIRNEVDYVDDNKCNDHYTGVQSTECSTDYDTHYSSAKKSEYNTYNDTHDSDYCGTLDGSYCSMLL